MRSYRYVGPEAIRAERASAERGAVIASPAHLPRWLAAHASEREGGGTPVTYVVGLDGTLRIAPRRSEHIACAGGEDVLAAGELVAVPGRVIAASNQSTGYCPDAACWPAVAAALERAGIAHPGRLTDAIVFRRCDGCGERNLVKDDDFTCAVCEAELPRAYNF